MSGASAGDTWGRRSTDTSSSWPAPVDTHVRPIRPRPASCVPATTTVHSGAPCSAMASRSVLVEPVSGRNRAGTGTPAARTTSATICCVSISPNLLGAQIIVASGDHA